ncbi:ABC transporter substrate-binding protein [Flexivirga aerilata]|nr:ABC transporter substrate-binding protein [Flexivirga aerilata]
MSRRMTRPAAVLAAALLATGTAGCMRASDYKAQVAGSANNTGGVEAGCTPIAKGKKPYIAIISKGFQHQFWQAVNAGAKKQAAKEGATITFNGPATEAEVQAQIDMLKTAITKSPDAVGFAALDSKAAAPIMTQLQQSKTPVIAFDSGVDSPVPLTTAATDSRTAAAAAAKHLAEKIGYQGTVGLVVHDQTSSSGIDRRDGFVDWMTKNAPKVKLLTPQYGGGDVSKSANLAKSLLAAHPDLAGIYGTNEGAAAGVVQGVKESGNSKVVVVGFDSGGAQLDAIRSGLEYGAITQNPIGIGEQVVASAMKALRCQPLPKKIDTGYFWYDKTNIDSPKIKPLLYR